MIDSCRAVFDKLKEPFGLSEGDFERFCEAFKDGVRYSFRSARSGQVVLHLMVDAQGRHFVPPPEQLDQLPLIMELNDQLRQPAA